MASPAFTPYNVDYATLDFSGADTSGASSPIPSDTSESGFWNGLGGILNTIGTTVARDYSAIAGPQTVRPGSVVYNPNTGQAQYVGAFGAASNPNMLLLLLGIGAVALILLARK